MSPLACCLVALAALFTVSNAKGIGRENPFCGGASLGKQSDRIHKTISFKMTVSGGDVIISDRCGHESKLDAQDLSVCNVGYSMPEIHPYEFGLHPLEKVYIDCPRSTQGCEKLELDVTQHCELGPVG